MADPISISADFSQIANLLSDSRALSIIQEEMVAIADQMSTYGLTQINNFTPVRTGALLASEQSETIIGQGQSMAGFEINWFSDIEYAPFIEDGTRYIAPFQMFKKGIEAANTEFSNIFEILANRVAERLQS